MNVNMFVGFFCFSVITLQSLHQLFCSVIVLFFVLSLFFLQKLLIFIPFAMPQSNWYLLVKSQYWEHQNNVLNI